jgi:hypothetical protein
MGNYPVRLVDFVQKDRFELNSYLTYLFSTFSISASNELRKQNKGTISKI